jgi:hypothetical protein
MQEVAALHFESIEAFEKLAEVLRVSAEAALSWSAAMAAASKWLGAVERTR